LLRFSGDYVTKFCGFWDSFKSEVDENDELSVVDKFNYLQSLLEGLEAKVYNSVYLIMRRLNRYRRDTLEEQNR